ncbi:MAG: alpha/beta fold hydrolase [bacterium]|nr:alpha/beta fold hydrolase [bacterium]
MESVERLVPPVGAFVEVGGARVHYVDRGQGPAIVLVHGLAGTLYNFTYALVERLAGSFRVVALDRTGAGYSSRPGGSSASLFAQAGTVAGLIERLELERPLVVGHSLGGAISLALALERPELVRGLALIAPLTQASKAPPPAFRPLYIRPALARRIVAYTVGVPMAKRLAPETIARIFAPEAVPDDFATRGGALLGLRASQFYHAGSDLVASVADMPELVRRYGELRVPVSVLFGRDDRILNPTRHGDGLCASVAHAQLTVIEGGHMIPATQPDAVAEWIEAQSA